MSHGCSICRGLRRASFSFHPGGPQVSGSIHLHQRPNGSRLMEPLGILLDERDTPGLLSLRMARKSCPSPHLLPRFHLPTATWPPQPSWSQPAGTVPGNGPSVPVGAVRRAGFGADAVWPGSCGPGRHHRASRPVSTRPPACVMPRKAILNGRRLTDRSQFQVGTRDDYMCSSLSRILSETLQPSSVDLHVFASPFLTYIHAH